VSQKSDWKRFVEQRRRELRDEFPCAMPTRRRVCPKHHFRVPQQTYIWRHNPRFDDWTRVLVSLSGICKPCRDQLFERLAAEFTAGQADEPSAVGEALRAARTAERRKPTEADATPPATFPGRKRKPLPGQLSLGDLTTTKGESEMDASRTYTVLATQLLRRTYRVTTAGGEDRAAQLAEEGNDGAPSGERVELIEDDDQVCDYSLIEVRREAS
jgi:hypothetical protein